MFCYQCEQAARGRGCDRFGVCGKDPATAALQDLLIHLTKSISQYAHRARSLGVTDRVTDVFVIEALFSTVTNVDFDPLRLQDILSSGAETLDRIRTLYEESAHRAGQEPDELSNSAQVKLAVDLAGMVAQGREFSLDRRIERWGADLVGLQELVLYGLKGSAAYADHAHVLGYDDDEIFSGFHRLLTYLAEAKPDAEALLGKALEAGELNLRVMELLDAANTGTFGHPEPTIVRVTPVKGKAIVVSGHDLLDLEALLRRTEGTGINVYTHGEMLPALAYPGLKKYAHLAGNYGGAWQDQSKEFDAFPGAILMTTNCIQKPRESYKGRIFTSGLVAWPGVTHVSRDDLSPVIEAALAAPGFTESASTHTITIGFGHSAVMGVAEQVIEAVKSGSIRHFFLIGGCDGAKPGRNYYTELAELVPDDCVILTLACGKYRFNKLKFGDIGGIPRLLDVGQCNDAYSAVKIAQALAEAFEVDINDLPLSLVLSWYEQKAVAVLLTLLHLGFKGIRLGPTLPPFITPAALQMLVEEFGLAPITTVQEDLAATLNMPV